MMNIAGCTCNFTFWLRSSQGQETNRSKTLFYALLYFHTHPLMHLHSCFPLVINAKGTKPIGRQARLAPSFVFINIPGCTFQWYFHFVRSPHHELPCISLKPARIARQERKQARVPRPQAPTLVPRIRQFHSHVKKIIGLHITAYE